MIDWNFYDALNEGISLEVISRTLTTLEELRTVVGEESEDLGPISYVPTVNVSGLRAA